jgi:type IV secretory pathway VirB2 component (pilin)
MNLKKPFLALSLALIAARAFAQDILPTGMSNLMNSVLGIFTGNFVKTILIICLCGCAIAYGFNKDNEKMKRNALAIGIAVAILVCANLIVEAIWTASQS